MSVHSVSIAKYRLKNDLYHAVSKYTEINPAYFSIDITRSDIHIKYMGEDR